MADGRPVPIPRSDRRKPLTLVQEYVQREHERRFVAMEREIEAEVKRREAVDYLAELAAQAAPQGSAAGLVSLSTSDTSPVLEVDTEAARLRRMKRRVVSAASVHEGSEEGKGLRPAMVTLTYRPGMQWSARHISETLKRVRQWCGRRGHRFRYVWTAELQARGAVHYHVVCWLPSGRGKNPPFWDDQGWWPYGASQCAWAKNAVGYIVKYASKIGSKDRLPCGARMHGAGGFKADERLRRSFEARPTWIRMLSYLGQRVRRAHGGGFVQEFACGLRRRLQSPYVLIARRSGRVVLARRGTDADDVRSAMEAIWPQINPQPA